MQGPQKNLWALKTPEDINNPLVQAWLKEAVTFEDEPKVKTSDAGNQPKA